MQDSRPKSWNFTLNSQISAQICHFSPDSQGFGLNLPGLAPICRNWGQFPGIPTPICRFGAIFRNSGAFIPCFWNSGQIHRTLHPICRIPAPIDGICSQIRGFSAFQAQFAGFRLNLGGFPPKLVYLMPELWDFNQNSQDFGSNLQGNGTKAALGGAGFGVPPFLGSITFGSPSASPQAALWDPPITQITPISPKSAPSQVAFWGPASP